MAGISSKALAFGSPQNRIKFNGIEETRDLELNQYDAFYRTLDPQIGRFWQIDPQVDILENYSPYETMGNNPISNIDPLGDFKTKFGAWWNRLWHGGGKIDQNEFGEWYIAKGKVTEDENGNTIVLSWRYYGEGRRATTAAGEYWREQEGMRMDLELNGEASMYREYSSQNEASQASLSMGVSTLLPNAFRGITTATNAPKILSRAERLAIFKERLLKAPKPKNPKEALKLINKILDKIEDSHAGAKKRMYGILDDKFVTYHENGSATALTRKQRIEISANGDITIYQRESGEVFLTKNE